MDILNINAELRPGGTKGDARKVRAGGSTPGIMYRAGESAEAIAFDGKALAAIFRKTADANSLINVTLGGKAHTCLVREIQRHPVSRRVEHVDFLEVTPGQRVAVRVGISVVGRAAGVRAGGQLRLLARSVNLDCDAFKVPKVVEVDVGPLEIGRFIKASQLPLTEGTRIVYAQDFNVVTVEGKIKDAAPAAAAADGKAAPAGKAAPKAAAKAAPAKK